VHAVGQVAHDLLQTVFPLPLEQIEAAVYSAGRWEGELVHTKQDGTRVVVASRWAVQWDERGAPVAILETNTDISERKRAEEELQASAEALRNAQTELARVTRVLTVGELTASIAHEVNQPITGVITNGQACLRWLAREEPDLEEARAAVHRIIRDGQRASQVITRIRALLQKGATQKGWLDLNHVLADILALARGEIRRADVSVETAFAAHLPPVWADRVQLQQVVLNLIVNAIEAMTPVLDRPRCLHLRTDVDGQWIRVTVRDTGVGLPPDGRDHMFETFYTTKPQGIGMGLAISQSIIQAHGGQLWAIPNDDHGATLLFTLPTGEEGMV
jgi:C4-dicarboxylate-specific signal transduction histidine kinase